MLRRVALRLRTAADCRCKAKRSRAFLWWRGRRRGPASYSFANPPAIVFPALVLRDVRWRTPYVWAARPVVFGEPLRIAGVSRLLARPRLGIRLLRHQRSLAPQCRSSQRAAHI